MDETIVGTVLVSLPAVLGAVLLGGATVGWRTGRDNWTVRMVFARRYTHPALTTIRRVRRTAVAGTGVLVLSAAALLVPSHWGPAIIGFAFLPVLLVRVGMMKADATRRRARSPRSRDASRTSSDR